MISRPYYLYNGKSIPGKTVLILKRNLVSRSERAVLFRCRCTDHRERYSVFQRHLISIFLPHLQRDGAGQPAARRLALLRFDVCDVIGALPPGPIVARRRRSADGRQQRSRDTGGGSAVQLKLVYADSDLVSAWIINPLGAKIFIGNKNVSTIYIIPPHWHDKGNLNPSSCKIGTYPFCTVNIMGADVLATQGTRT